MLGSLGIHSKKSLFVIHPSPLTEGLTLPADWRVLGAKTNEELLKALETAREEKLRLVVLVGASHFLSVLELFKRRLRDDNSLSYGVVVVAEKPVEFLSQRSGFAELLEVMSEPDSKKNLEFHLSSANSRSGKFQPSAFASGTKELGSISAQRSTSPYL